VLRTPLRRSPWLSAATGGDVSLKLETLQPTFSYKIRGALNAVLRLVEAGGAVRPLVTASAGNHGRALAYAAREAGLRLTVYVPESAPRVKLDAIRQTGAELRPSRDYDEAERLAKAHGATGDALFISPYSNPDVIAGAGTIALEILQERPDVDTFVVPIGGGGLISGIGIAASAAASGAERAATSLRQGYGGPPELQRRRKGSRGEASLAGRRGVPDSRTVLGVEVEASCPFTQSLAAGRIVEIDVGPTLADGLAGNMDPDTITFDLVKRYVSRIAVITEGELRAAVGAIAREERLIAEGAGATGVAAVASGTIDLHDRRVAIVLSGANIDGEKLKELL
jgi:threonine dehydratase